MLIPLIVLAIGAAFSGYLGYDFFVGEGQRRFLEERDPGAAAA